MTEDRRPLVADSALARRMEMTDAIAGVEFARAWAQMHSYPGEVAIEVAGGFAGFAGVDSPVTQAFGLGFAGPVTHEDIESMEDFYRARGSAVNIETCPLADPSLVKVLLERGYEPIEASNVFARELTAGDENLWPDQSTAVRVRTPKNDEVDAYTELVTRSFFENGEVTPELLDIFQSTFYAKGAHFFVAEIDGVPAGGGMMSIHRGVASLGGAGTLPQFRNRGAQKALILARLATAARAGCDLAMVATALGTVSQRNVERQGFSLVYERSKLIRRWK
jgi:ribosomal protein S18 acetylase RimI-like enzyme